jgi:hypothetical protein
MRMYRACMNWLMWLMGMYRACGLAHVAEGDVQSLWIGSSGGWGCRDLVGWIMWLMGVGCTEFVDWLMWVMGMERG